MLCRTLLLCAGVAAIAAGQGTAPPPSREVLTSMTGEYNAGSVMITIALRPDGTLTSRIAETPEAELQHERDLRFTVKGQPGIAVEFRRNSKGEIFALTSHQPNGSVPAIRQSKDPLDAAVLRTLPGMYEAGDKKFSVELTAAGVLTFTVVGSPSVELMFARDLLFTVRGSAGAYIEFVRGPNGVITGLFVHSATSIFASRFR